MNARLAGAMSIAEISSAYRVITAGQVDLLIREGEGLTVEFKERYTLLVAEEFEVCLGDVVMPLLIHAAKDSLTATYKKSTYS